MDEHSERKRIRPTPPHRSGGRLLATTELLLAIIIVASFLSALLCSGLYLLGDRNLWVPILADGMENTVAFMLIFIGRYPGL